MFPWANDDFIQLLYNFLAPYCHSHQPEIVLLRAMATPERFFVFALFVAVLLSCTHTSSAARPVPSDDETRPSEPLAGSPLSSSSVAQPIPKFTWLPMWVAMKVLPNLQSLGPVVPAASASATQSTTSSTQPMFMGFPGFGFPGFGFPGMGSGFPGPITTPII